MINEQKIQAFSPQELEAYTSKLSKPQILDHLKVDPLYYGKFGQQWYSNSFLSQLIDDPLLQEPDKEWGNGSALVIGRFVHQYFLEPDKWPDFPYVDVPNRHHADYKAEIARTGERWMLTTKDKDKWTDFCKNVKNHPDVIDVLWDKDNYFEQPEIEMLNGLPIKGKADIVNHKKKLIIDIKTTSDLPGFKDKIEAFKYDIQAALYSYMFNGYDFRFVALDKRSGDCGVFDLSKNMLEYGRSRLYKAINIYKHYHLKEENRTFFHLV